MNEKLVEKMNPKPKFNLKWYKQDDLYSEGAIEDKIVELIAENPPEDYVRAVYDNYNWSTYYHLTQVRKNILNWYPFKQGSDVLEIGCGLGAITGILCDKCQTVTAVELSKRRATAALLRCRERENLEIIVGNLNEIEFDKKFDYITLIGVLEYQGKYTDTDNPYRDFLQKVKSLLKPDGKLLIAIENQYGLKYWCGAKEDHTGMPYDGINQYALTNQGVRTFSKAALEQLIKESGFKHTYFYYPMPDYKLPTVIYSERYLPENSHIENIEFYYASGQDTLLADEKKIYGEVIENKAFEFMANSFFVECSDSEMLGEVVFASLCTSRQREYQIGTRIRKDGIVEKFPIYHLEGTKHIRQTVENEQQLRERGVEILGSSLEDDMLKVAYTDAPTLEDLFLNACKSRNKEQAFACLDILCEELVKSSDEALPEENIMYAFGIGDIEKLEKYGRIQKKGYIDMTLKNAFYIDGKPYWYDQEWMLDNVPAKYILYRAIKMVSLKFQNVNMGISLNEMIETYGLQEVWDDFEQLEVLFINSILDGMQVKEEKMIQGLEENICMANIRKITDN